MINSYISKKFMPVGFLLGLFASPQNYDFILTAPDNISQIGKGEIRKVSTNSVQVQVVVNGKEFSGSGELFPPPRTNQKDIRSDRAFMAPRSVPYLKHGFITMKEKDGAPSSLVCEFYIKDSKVDGHCFDPENKSSLALLVHSTSDGRT